MFQVLKFKINKTNCIFAPFMKFTEMETYIKQKQKAKIVKSTETKKNIEFSVNILNVSNR